MSYKKGDRVLHDSGWSAVIKSGTNENGFTIEFDKMRKTVHLAHKIQLQ